METCIQCLKQFNPYEAEFDCENCDEFGQIPDYNDYAFNSCDTIDCPNCKGEKTYTCLETQFCSDDCREDYFYPHTDFI